MKKLSIITINFNNREGLRRTLKSVAGQSTQDFQYIVIDGGSTDGSVDVIKEYEDYIDFWISEPDKGIYNAMNKGVSHATGEYCNFLNSGDFYCDCDVIRNLYKLNIDSDIIAGVTTKVRLEHGDLVHVGELKPPKIITTDVFLITSINHQASFIRTELLRQNPYDESLKIVSDWKFFFQELIIYNRSYSCIPLTIVKFDVSGISTTNGDLCVSERECILKSIFPPKVVEDYLSLIQGRTPLNRLVNSSSPDGLVVKSLTFVARCLSKFEKIIRPFRRLK